MDEPFEPRLGRIGSAGTRRGGRYLRRVLIAATRAGSPKPGRRKFDGSRIGTGAGLARLLRGGQHERRAIVKIRLVRLGGKGLGAARAHLRYIERDGVQRDGSPGIAYSASNDVADAGEFLQRSAGDRHQFRLILSAEDGTEYDDLKPLVRRYMSQMEEDLGTKLEWVAVDHTDTAHPHTHVILKGRDDRAQNLVIAREYICHGMRERLAELVTRDLGPRQEFEIRHKLRQEITAERLTSIDRALIKSIGIDNSVQPSQRDPFRHALRAGRLKKLEALGLAEPLAGGRWRLDQDLEERLRALGERRDIIRTIQRELTAKGLDRAPADWCVSGLPANGLVGRVVARGLSDELSDRHYLIVDGADGRVHYIEIGASTAVEPLPSGGIVEVTRAAALIHETVQRPREIDAANEGRTWAIGSGQVAQVRQPEKRRRQMAPARVELLSALPIERLASCEGASWLDRRLATDEPMMLRDAGFGREVRSALALRRQWLLDQRLADETGGKFALCADALQVLEWRELTRAAARLSAELGKPFVAAEHGGVIHGKLARRIDLASGRFVLLESSHEFTFVPWRPVLERYLDLEVQGIVRSGQIGWTIGRGRTGPAI